MEPLRKVTVLRWCSYYFQYEPEWLLVDKIESSHEIHKGNICFLLKFSSLFYQLPDCECLLHGRPSWHEASLLDSSLASEEIGKAFQEGHNEELPGHREECDATIVGADSATAFPFSERQNDARSPVFWNPFCTEYYGEQYLEPEKGRCPTIFQQFCRDTTDSQGSVVFHPLQRFQDLWRGEWVLHDFIRGVRVVRCNLRKVRIRLTNTVQV